MRKFVPVRLTAPGFVALSLITCGAASAQNIFSDIEQELTWSSAGNGLTNAHYAPFEFFLGRDTLPLLQPRWIFSADGEVQGTPTVENDSVFFSDAGGSVWRLNAISGSVVWKTSLPSITGNSMSYSRVSPGITSNLVIVGDQASGTLFALSKNTGALVWQTVLATNQGAIITSSPVFYNGTIYVGVSSDQESLASTTPNFVPDFRGSIAALDVNTGNVLWQTYVIPNGYTGGAVWASNLAIDPSRSALYASTGNNYSVPASVAACQAVASTPVALDACLAPDDHIDSVLALDLNTGAIRWSQRFAHADTWTTSCLQSKQPPATPCPTPTGLDTDFGSAPNLFTINYQGRPTDVVGAGQKSGAYYTMNRDTGAILWGTQVGPDGDRGGIEWGSATDGTRLYMGSANSQYVPTTLIPSGQTVVGGFWSALDPATGQILWQTATTSPAPIPMSARASQPPAGSIAEAEGSVSVANGIMYGEDAAGNFVALDAATGQILESFQSGGAGISAPAIAAGTLYWASGYSDIGATNNKVYAFSILGL